MPAKHNSVSLRFVRRAGASLSDVAAYRGDELEDVMKGVEHEDVAWQVSSYSERAGDDIQVFRYRMSDTGGGFRFSFHDYEDGELEAE